jgi:rhodanese-related sulfurtransferase
MTTYDFDRANQYFRDRMAFTTGVHELDLLIHSRKDPATYQVVDLRAPEHFAAGHAPGAINLPRGKWSNPKGLKKDATLYLYCYNQTCHLAPEAAVALTAQGYRVVEVEGGWAAWQANGYRTESEQAA